MKKVLKGLFFVLVVLAMLSVAWRFGGAWLTKSLGLEGRSGLKVEANRTAKVVVDGKVVGQTPYSGDKMVPGVSFVELVGEGGYYWSGRVSLNDGTVTVVNRELSVGVASSSGEVISLERGSGAMVTSFPVGSLVVVDGKDAGITPLYIEMTWGEHVFELSKSGYLNRSIRVNIPEGQRLLMNVDLSLGNL